MLFWTTFDPVCFWFEDIFLLNWVIFQKKTHFGQNEGVLVPVTLIRTHHMKAKDCTFLVLKGQNVFGVSLKVMRVSFKNLWELSFFNYCFWHIVLWTYEWPHLEVSKMVWQPPKLPKMRPLGYNLWSKIFSSVRRQF